jgi:tetratricopeptide (TPR) repeat protein
LRQSEQEQRLREAEQRQRAEAALRVAMESLNELFAQIESNRRPGQRLAADEARSMLEALGRMLAFYKQLAEHGQQDPQAQIRMAEALRRMGDLRRNLEEYEDAEQMLLEAIDLLSGLVDVPELDIEVRIQHARANYTLGRVYRDMDRFDEGDVLIQSAIAELEALPDDAAQRRHIQELLNRFRRDIPRAAGELRLPLSPLKIIVAEGFAISCECYNRLSTLVMLEGIVVFHLKDAVKYTHAHPYLTTDNCHVIFNSNVTAVTQVDAATVPIAFLDKLAPLKKKEPDIQP